MTDATKTITHLDETICKLESMGTILELVSTTESGVYPDLSSLADLGRIIQCLAMEALEIVSEMEFKSREPTNDGQAKNIVIEG